MAVASLALGITSLIVLVPTCVCVPMVLLSPVTGVLAIVLGEVDKRRVVTAGLPKRGMATAGVICGCVALGLFVLAVSLLVVAAVLDEPGGFEFYWTMP